MANAGDQFQKDAGDAFFNLVAPTLPTNLYIAAFTDSVNNQGVGTEVADPASNTVNYARAQLPVAPAFTEFSLGIYFLTNNLDFNQAQGGNWGTIVSIALVSAATGALGTNVIAFGDVTTPKLIEEFDILRVSGGSGFTLTIA